MSKNVQYITDAEGNKTAVVLPLEEYEELMADLHLMRVARESEGEDCVPWEQVRAELIKEGKLER